VASAERDGTREAIRAFIAVELLHEIRRLLAKQQDELKRAMGSTERGVRWSRSEGVHLTLQFLGNVPPSVIPSISQAIRDACAGAQPASLSLGAVGAFPNVTRPRVLWVGLEGDIGKLSSLAGSIAERLKPLGYKPDKPFQPHITLGRVRETVRPDELRAISLALSAHVNRPAKSTFVVSSISLMQSYLQAGGSVYTQLANVKLG
jgi:2'-5' RNA ligase